MIAQSYMSEQTLGDFFYSWNMCARYTAGFLAKVVIATEIFVCFNIHYVLLCILHSFFGLTYEKNIGIFTV